MVLTDGAIFFGETRSWFSAARYRGAVIQVAIFDCQSYRSLELAVEA